MKFLIHLFGFLARLPPSAFAGATRGASYASRFPVVCCRCPEGAESPFCGATAANRCCFESACLRELVFWRLQPRTSMCTNGLVLLRPFVPRIAT